jgi:hypothetical protein
MTMKKRELTASEMGRKGGKAKVPKGFSMLTKEQRAEIAAKGVAARKAKKRG